MNNYGKFIKNKAKVSKRGNNSREEMGMNIVKAKWDQIIDVMTKNLFLNIHVCTYVYVCVRDELIKVNW